VREVGLGEPETHRVYIFLNIWQLLQNSRHQKGYMHQGTVNITVNVSYISSHPLKFIGLGTSIYELL